MLKTLHYMWTELNYCENIWPTIFNQFWTYLYLIRLLLWIWIWEKWTWVINNNCGEFLVSICKGNSRDERYKFEANNVALMQFTSFTFIWRFLRLFKKFFFSSVLLNVNWRKLDGDFTSAGDEYFRICSKIIDRKIN